jgi:uncharacterized Zn-finger protein
MATTLPSTRFEYYTILKSNNGNKNNAKFLQGSKKKRTQFYPARFKSRYRWSERTFHVEKYQTKSNLLQKKIKQKDFADANKVQVDGSHYFGNPEYGVSNSISFGAMRTLFLTGLESSG